MIVRNWGALRVVLAVLVLSLCAGPIIASSASASTVGQRNALSSAESYLSSMAFSRSGLIHQLEFEGYSGSQSRWAVRHVRFSWRYQAYKSAKSYLRSMSFSRSGLIDQLEFEGFTHYQARYGVWRAYR